MKIVYILARASNCGKTATLNTLKAKLILLGYKEIANLGTTSPGDILCVLKKGRKTVGINSAGDNSYYCGEIVKLMPPEYDCDIIFCASHTGRLTKGTIEGIAHANGYKTECFEQLTISGSVGIFETIRNEYVADFLIRAAGL